MPVVEMGATAGTRGATRDRMPILLLLFLGLFLWPAGTPRPSNEERMMRKIAALRAEIEALRAEKDALAVATAAPAACGPPPLRVVAVSEAELSEATTIGGAGPGARLSPVFRSGATRAHRVYAIRPGSLWERVGLLNGDLLVWPVSFVDVAAHGDPMAPALVIERDGCTQTIVLRIAG